MRRALVTTALAVFATVAAATLGTGHAAGQTASDRTSGRGGPGHWTKVSTGDVGIIYQPSLVRTSDGVLHLVYPKGANGATNFAHTAIHSNGSIAIQNDVLPSEWASTDDSPVVLATGTSLRVVFGGIQSINPGYWSDGRMYDATSGDSGATWALPAEAIGLSHSAYGSYGTAATTLADGTPIAGFPLNSDFTWHVGTSESTPDGSYTFGSCCLYSATMVRDGSNVWAAWYANGSTEATEGTFVMQIYPTVGSPIKAPGSSVGVSSLPTGRVALTTRVGGGVYAAYCVGYPTCTYVRVWKVGTTQTAKVPHSKYATPISMSPGPSGRLWVAWADNIPRVRAVRTGISGLSMGAVRTAGMPHGAAAAYSLAVNGTRGRGDLVVNVGDALWHTQVFAGLTLQASPHRWRHGTAQTVTFKVTDAGDPVHGAQVKVGAQHCTTTTHGACSLHFASSFGTGTHTAKATKTGYSAATTGLKVT
jgi:hypothetical protein